MPLYPADTGRTVKALRFANLLDDVDNKLSPTKFNLWAANVTGISTVAATIIAWITAHWAMLDHIMSVAPVVGAYLGGSHASNHYDKKLAQEK